MGLRRWRGRAFPGRPDPTKICLKGGFDPRQVYELIYTAKNPIIMGLGLSAIRDAASFFRHATKDDAGTANPLAGAVRFAEVVGDSQGGNLIRSFLQLGFNRDESGQTVFEGANTHLAGKRTIVNERFATPGTGSTQYEYPMMPGGEAPLTWEAETDPVSGKPMGLLDRCIATKSCPRIIQTFTSTEYRQYAIAFNTVDPSGTRDFTLPPNVRLYFLTGSQHGTLTAWRRRCPPAFASKPGTTRPIWRAGAPFLSHLRIGSLRARNPLPASTRLSRPPSWPRLMLPLSAGPTFRE
jgi:Alpha/beta hydrolase domain